MGAELGLPGNTVGMLKPSSPSLAVPIWLGVGLTVSGWRVVGKVFGLPRDTVGANMEGLPGVGVELGLPGDTVGLAKLTSPLLLVPELGLLLTVVGSAVVGE